MKRLAAQFLVLFFVGVAALFSLFGHAENRPSFNVGVVIPLTGDLADYGTSIRAGFDLAMQQSPERFANMHFVFEDSKYDATTAVSVMQKLRATKNIDIYYAWGVSPTEAIVPITEANKLPLIVETTIKETTVDKKYVIRAARTGERIAQSLAAELAAQKTKKVSLLFTEIPFYEDIINHLKIQLSKQGIEITRVRNILPSENEMRTFLPELLRQGEDAVGVFLLPQQIISFYKRVSERKMAFKTFSADIIGSESIIKDCPDSVNGTFFTEVGVTPEFRTLYNQKLHGEGHIGHAAQAFDVANLLADLFGNLKERASADDIMTALSKVAPRKGATGSYRYSDTADSGKELKMPVAMKVIRDKKIETIAEDTGF